MTKDNVAKYATWMFLLKFLIVAFAAGFVARAMWPVRSAKSRAAVSRTNTPPVIIGEGELNPEFQQGGPEPLEGQGIAVQVPLPGDGGAIDESFHAVLSQVRPAVIKILVMPDKTALGAEPALPKTGIKMGDPFAMSQKMAVGSGVIIDPKGLFITTKHVVGESNNLQVVLYRAGQRQYTARVIARDPDSPLVIGKIRAANQVFPYARLGDSDRLRTGDVVMAVGNPFGLSGTVTSGIVSGKKDVVVQGLTIQNAIQMDATVNDGNAGGPLVNVDGEVVGITFASYVQGGNFTGIGFAVPINFAKEAWGAAAAQ
ncbi:trypsin-like peptidase domain-containing protein [Bdellovibrionota bacterium FG-1]